MQMMIPLTSKLPHMVQLDALRAIAVLAVLVHHYIPGGWGEGGVGGVKFFFVLSGFLITSILLRSRNEMELTGESWSVVLRRFYARRFLRIFPLYYFVIAVAVVINLEPARNILGWLLTYTLNFHMAAQGWYEDRFAHFWTLAVEEQFYIVWPFLVLLAPRRLLLLLFLATIMLGPLSRLYEVSGGNYSLAAYISILANLDSLGMGALLALLLDNSNDVTRARGYVNKLVLPAGLGMLAILALPMDWRVNTVFGNLAVSFVFCWLVSAASKGFGGAAGVLLQSRLLVYIGKISYGVYVYHPFMPEVWAYAFARMGVPFDDKSALSFVLSTALALLCASLSWHLMEKPLNDLKRFFEAPPAQTEKNKPEVQQA